MTTNLKESKMKVLRVMNSTGDTRMEFEVGTSAEQEARELFERMILKGAAAFAVNRAEGEPDKRITNFSDLEGENLLVPLIVGG